MIIAQPLYYMGEDLLGKVCYNNYVRVIMFNKLTENHFADVIREKIALEV